MTKAQKYVDTLAVLPKTPTLELGNITFQIGSNGDLWIEENMLCPDSVLQLRDWLTEWFDEVK